jgi:hypothetical protein
MAKMRTKIWVGVGAFVVAGSGTVAAAVKLPGGDGATAPATVARAATVLAQHDHATTPDSPMPMPAEAGEAGESGASQNLPPDLAFSVRIGLIRGHLGVGDELVQQKEWLAALPHFLHPSEEIYGDIKDVLKDYDLKPFDGALKTLADAVKAKNSDDYARAVKAVDQALFAAETAVLKKQQAPADFSAETAIELMKTATGEYAQAIEGTRIAKPVEYQDARGFIWQADRMLARSAAALEKKDAEAFKKVRDGVAALKKVFPTPVPPRDAVKDADTVKADVSRIEVDCGPLL